MYRAIAVILFLMPLAGVAQTVQPDQADPSVQPVAPDQAEPSVPPAAPDQDATAAPSANPPGGSPAEPPAPGQGLPFPSYDINSICSYTRSKAASSACAQQQQNAENQILPMWNQLTPYDQQIAGMYGDYVDMLPTVTGLYQREQALKPLSQQQAPQTSAQ